MATLVAIGYPDQVTAEQARDTVSKLEAELVIQADQVAAISRDMEGKYVNERASYRRAGGSGGGRGVGYEPRSTGALRSGARAQANRCVDPGVCVGSSPGRRRARARRGGQA